MARSGTTEGNLTGALSLAGQADVEVAKVQFQVAFTNSLSELARSQASALRDLDVVGLSKDLARSVLRPAAFVAPAARRQFAF